MTGNSIRLADWIAVDWGTSRLRVWGIASDGSVIGHSESDKGAGALKQGEFERALLAQISPLVNSERRVLVVICGMAGSRQGWLEAPYAELPVSLLDIAQKAVPVKTEDERIDVRVLPGLSQYDKIKPDVIRGEETQLLGLVNERPNFCGSVCLPGTHSKWVKIENSHVSSMQTYLTGELYDLLSRNSMLRHTVGEAATWDENGFIEGIERAKNADFSILSNLFAIRAHDLLFEVNPDRASSYLSGLLIGDEIRHQAQVGNSGPVALLGAENLAEKYRIALELFSVEVEVHNSEALTLKGLKFARSTLG